ncbi:MAG: hypothetical protein Q9218_003705 [Villophora microphyllina]
MTATLRRPELPGFLFSSWLYRPGDLSEAKKSDELRDHTLSSLCSAYLKYQFEQHDRQLQANTKFSVPSLTSISVGQILHHLGKSNNLQADIEEVADRLSIPALLLILRDPRTPYLVLRILDALPLTTIQGNHGERKLVDIDEAILTSEKYIRHHKSDARDGYLVTLRDLSSVIAPLDLDGTITCKRKTPPNGGFEFLNQKRQPVCRYQGSDESFIKTFNRVTHGALKGLNWTNVFVAGGMVLNTLLHTDPTKDQEKDILECDIDLYLYGLTPEEANRKVKEIEAVWIRNDELRCMVQGDEPDPMVIKNAKTITFIPRYPNRRIQIVLKLTASPLDILLKVDIDACAVGFDGTRVLMLPRCARAIETGYSVFTMDLIWGHHLGNRRETQESRLSKYADRGFGLRILPSYVRSLEDHCNKIDELSVENLNKTHRAFFPGHRKVPSRIIEGEPGVKTLRRIEYFARRSVKEYIHQEQCNPEDREEAEYREEMQLPLLIFPSELDGKPIGEALVESPRGLVGFELLMRYHETWRMAASGKARLEMAFPEARYHDTELSDPYMDLPVYDWGPNNSMALHRFERQVDRYNRVLVRLLKRAISNRLNVDPRWASFTGYLTRPIRRFVVREDFEAVRARYVTIPLIVPMDLETDIVNAIQSRCEDLPDNLLADLLIPVHNPAKYDPTTATLPSLHDTDSEEGNFRYWRMTPRTMWAGQNRTLDEVIELLKFLTSWFMNCDQEPRGGRGGPGKFEPNTSTKNCLYHIARMLSPRLVLPEASDQPERGRDLSPREMLLFRAWALHTPPQVKMEEQSTLLEDEMANIGDVPDALFWQEGSEGTWGDEDGVPLWLDYRPGEKGSS